MDVPVTVPVSLPMPAGPPVLHPGVEGEAGEAPDRAPQSDYLDYLR